MLCRSTLIFVPKGISSLQWASARYQRYQHPDRPTLKQAQVNNFISSGIHTSKAHGLLINSAALAESDAAQIVRSETYEIDMHHTCVCEARSKQGSWKCARCLNCVHIGMWSVRSDKQGARGVLRREQGWERCTKLPALCMVQSPA